MKHTGNNSAFCRNIGNGYHRRSRAAVALLLALALLVFTRERKRTVRVF